MSRKLISAAVVAVLLLAIVSLLVLLRPRPVVAPSRSGPAPVVNLEGPASPDLGAPTLPIADPTAYSLLNSVNTTAQDDVGIVDGLLQNMQQSLKTAAVPPLGFNEEITRALTGRNPLELAFIPSTHPAINPRGLLCDRWGTPFHFHPIAHDRIDVRSAGPDKKLFTTDDLVSASSAAVSGPVADPEA